MIFIYILATCMYKFTQFCLCEVTKIKFLRPLPTFRRLPSVTLVGFQSSFSPMIYYLLLWVGSHTTSYSAICEHISPYTRHTNMANLLCGYWSTTCVRPSTISTPQCIEICFILTYMYTIICMILTVIIWLSLYSWFRPHIVPWLNLWGVLVSGVSFFVLFLCIVSLCQLASFI